MEKQDLVVDVRETWKRWAWRQMNFEDPPMRPRDEIPEEEQPHKSFYGKISCFMNGVDPYPPRLGPVTVGDVLIMGDCS